MVNTTSNRGKIVVVTDVPFWLGETGAQKRISELVSYLSDSGLDVAAYFLGSLNEAKSLTNKSVNGHSQRTHRQLADEKGFQLVSAIDHWEPESWLSKFVWKCQCILHWIAGIANRDTKGIKTEPVSSRRMQDFVSSQWRQRFQKFVDDSEPDIVIVEYATLVYLLPERSQRGSIQYWVDTHDVLSSRCEQFREHNEAHWVEVSKDEEAAAIDRFDGVIAIQEDEAKTFRTMVSHGQPVVVAGYSGALFLSEDHQERIHEAEHDTSNEISIGIIASNNRANQHGIFWFLENVWPAIQSQTERIDRGDTRSDRIALRLILAGTICDQIPDHLLDCSVVTLGRVKSVDEFYRQVQIVVNPVQFGTGLKIKNIEAIRYQKPLVISGHAASGMMHSENRDQGSSELWAENPLDDQQRSPWIVAETAEEMVAAIVELAESKAARERLTNAARSYAEVHLTPQQVYCELLKSLRIPPNS